MSNTPYHPGLFDSERGAQPLATSSTFQDNTRLPVHRWFRYSAGFSGSWVEQLLSDRLLSRPDLRVLDPFAGSVTTLLAAQNAGVESWGVESHPFVVRVARAKLARASGAEEYRKLAREILRTAADRPASIDSYPALVRKCYRDETLIDLDRLRQCVEERLDGSPAAELAWLTLVGILRSTSHVGTANWQYVLPKKDKKSAIPPFQAFEWQLDIIYRDMLQYDRQELPQARLIQTDARLCDGIPDATVNLVVTSPPYPNNYDYADATRLEMSFLGEISGWGDLQNAVRRHLVRSCSQHVPERAVNLEEVLSTNELEPIREEISSVCGRLAAVRLTKGGKKTYHLMVACYFLDLAKVWRSLRRVCTSPCEVCFVIGDSAPYGVYVPVMDWLGRLASASGFETFRFEKTRDRNVKWKNRKHRVPLREGRLWVLG